MTALLYLVVAVLAAAFGIRAWLMGRDESARQAFLGLGVTVALTQGAFALSLLPGLDGLRTLYVAAGTAIPAFALWCVDRLFAPEGEHLGLVRRCFAATLVVIPGTTLLHALFFAGAAHSSPPEVVAGIFTFSCFGLVLWRLWEAHEATGLHVDKVRLRYLLAVAAAAVLLTLVEQLTRNVTAPIDPDAIRLASRGVVLQGPIPPFGAVLTGLALYFLYQILVLYRLLDLHELFSRIAALGLSALALVLVDGITVMWVDTFSEHPVHTTFQIFLASVLFLAAYDPMRVHIGWWSNRLFNQRGQQLTDTLDALRAEIPTVISTRGLTDTMLSRLHASGRVPVCSVYLWDRNLDAFALAGVRGPGDRRPLKAVAAQPFTAGFASGEPWYIRASLVRRARHEPVVAEALALMDAMQADLTVPFVRGEVVLGWMHLRDEDWSDGFSADEIQRLRHIADLASVVLANIQDFQALEEEHRLAALGAMAAGLAHEIRNPLAGIKGAAQYLQAESFEDDAQEMLGVIVTETDRLDLVVRQFLDYARPLELRVADDQLNDLVAHALALLRAQGVPLGVVVREQLDPDLPALPIDRARLSQVLLNLLRNALQAMEQGGTLTLSTRRRAGRSGQPVAELAVSDTGTGVAPDDVEKLFVPFFTTKEDGTGLGLPICQRIVQAHGGELDVTSAVGEGTTFVVRLPLPEEREEEVPLEAESGAA